MYIPAHFKIDDLSQMVAFMKAHSFATVISSHEGRPFASHLPLLVDEEAHCLYGHFARPNPQWTDVEQQEVLTIFQGPHCYISPSWYGTTAAVPTWNYSAVHVYGLSSCTIMTKCFASFIVSPASMRRLTAPMT